MARRHGMPSRPFPHTAPTIPPHMAAQCAPPNATATAALVTTEHQEARARQGPCPEHCRSYVNVRRAMGTVVDGREDETGEVPPLGETG